MATIKFATGQTVNFNGNPTQQDIEEVAQKLNIKGNQLNQTPTGTQNQTGLGAFSQAPNTSTTPIPEAKPQSFLDKAGNFFGKIESPIVGLAATPLQLGVKAYNKITGSNVQDPFAKGIPTGIGKSTADVTPLDLEKKLGDVAQVASLFVPGEGVLGAMGTGAMMGVGSQMSQGANLSQTALGGLTGAAVGGVVGGATKLAGMGLNKLGDLATGKSANEAISGIKDAYSSALNLNASERGFESRSGKDLADILLKNEATLGRYENGTLDASNAIDKLQTTLEPLNEQANKILNEPQGIVKDTPLQDVLDSVIQRINKLKINPTEAKNAIKIATQNIQDTTEKYGDTVQPGVLDVIKQGFQGSAFKKALTTSDQLQSNVSYLISDEARKATEQAVAGTDAGNILGKLNLQRSDLIDALTRLTKLDGTRLVKGGKLGNMAGGLAGTIMGAAGGNPLTALAGDYFGTKAAEFLNNPATRIAIAQGKAKAAGVIPGLLGKYAEPVGNAITKTGNVVKKSARATGLLGNILTK